MGNIRNWRWIVAGLVFLSTVINYIDRQTLSILAPRLTRDLHLSETQYGYIVQAFLITYTLVYIPAGILLDRYGVKKVYALATGWWSLTAMLHACVTTAFSLGFVRALLGLGEGFNFIAATRVAAEWYPPKERAMLSGIANAAAVSGAIITPPLTVWILLRWGWRETFLITGALGFVWILLWLSLYHSPERHPYITREEFVLIRPPGDREPATTKIPYREILKARNTWGLLLARTFSDPVWWFYLFWLPKYLTQGRGLSLTTMSMIVWIPYLASDFGSIIGGWLSGRLISLKESVVKARRKIMFLSVLIMPIGLILPFLKSTYWVIGVVCVVLFGHMSWKTNLMTLTVDVFPKQIVGTVAGIVGTGSGIGAAVFTGLAGYIIQNHSYTPVFVIMATMHPVGYLIVRLMVCARESSSESMNPSSLGVEIN
jgi:MFS transporter, ACS family, hexuronate transporter